MKLASLLATTLIATSAFAAAVGGGQGGNGGGGVLENGRYMTFHSAGVVVDATPKTLEQIPGLSKAIRFIDSANYLSADAKSSVEMSMTPSEKHIYYDVRADKFSPIVRRALMQKCSEVTGTPVDHETIYAITDPDTNTTYLLPEFYKLQKVTEQEAILFHETLWIMHGLRKNSDSCDSVCGGDWDYNKIISAEIAFQTHLENPNDYQAAQKVARTIGTTKDVAKLAYLWDRQSGVISADGTISGGPKLTISFLFGNALTPTGTESMMCLRA